MTVVKCDKHPADYCVIFQGSEVISAFDFVVGACALREQLDFREGKVKALALLMISLSLSGCVGITTHGKIGQTQCSDEIKICFVEHWLTQRAINPPPASAYAINLKLGLTTKSDLITHKVQPSQRGASAWVGCVKRYRQNEITYFLSEFVG